MNAENIKITSIKNKNLENLTADEVKEKLEKFLCDICSITSVEARIEEMFRRKCAEEFPSFESVVCCFSTTPKIANIYFKGHEAINVVCEI